MNELAEARNKIEDIDRKMAELFTERMKCSEQIASYKKENGIPILDSNREKVLVDKNEQYITENDLKPYYRQFIRSVIDVSKQYQHKLVENTRIAYSGIEGAFANIAAKRLFPDGEPVPYRNFKEAYRAVSKGSCDVAVLPLENSNAGEVGQVMDLIYEGDLYINGIYPLSISQNLLGVEGSSIGTIKKVISHPHALEQCADYITEHDFEQIQAANTAMAAKQVADAKDITMAAIASKETAALYGLTLLDHDINEDAQNATRFAVLSRNREDTINASEKASVILMFSVKNEAGMLAKAIAVIGKHGFSMNALRSRPLKTLSWQYYFYTEIEGNLISDELNRMIEEMSEYCISLKVAGATL